MWVAGIVGKFLGPPMVRRVGGDITLYVGLILILVAGILLISFILWHVLTISLLMLAVMLSIVGQVFMMPTTAARAMSPFHDKRGTAGALYGGFQMLIAFVSSAIIGSLAVFGVTVLGLAYVLLGLLGLLIYLAVCGDCNSFCGKYAKCEYSLTKVKELQSVFPR